MKTISIFVIDYFKCQKCDLFLRFAKYSNNSEIADGEYSEARTGGSSFSDDSTIWGDKTKQTKLLIKLYLVWKERLIGNTNSSRENPRCELKPFFFSDQTNSNEKMIRWQDWQDD